MACGSLEVAFVVALGQCLEFYRKGNKCGTDGGGGGERGGGQYLGCAAP